MIKLAITFLASVLLFGCSSDTKLLHSPSFTKVSSSVNALENEYLSSKDILNSQKDNIIPTVIQFGVVDGFYVNTDHVDKQKKIILPELFNENVSIKISDTKENIIQGIFDFVYDATGVNLIKPKSNKKTPSGDMGLSTKPLSELVSNSTIGTKDGISLSKTFNEPQPVPTQTKSTTLEKKIDFEFSGSISNMINRVATMQKSRWRFDATNNSIVFYNVITKSFVLPIPPSNGSSSISVSSSGSASGGGNSGSTSSSMSSSNTSDPWASIKEDLNSMVSDEGRVIINKDTGFVEISDTLDGFHVIESYLNGLIDLYSTQLLVDVRVVHLSNQTDNSKETNWNTINNKIGQVVASSSFGNPANITAASSLLLGYKVDTNAENNNISAAINLLSTYAESYSVDSFSAITTNFTPVPIQLSSEAVFFDQTISNGDANNPADVTVVSTANTKQLGTTITLTPSVIDNFINLSYVFQKTHQTAIVEDPQGAQYPLTATKTFVQNVKLKNGLPMVISAINSEESTANAISPLATGAWFLGGSESSKESNTKDIVLVTVSKLKQDLNDHKKNYYDDDIITTSKFLSR